MGTIESDGWDEKPLTPDEIADLNRDLAAALKHADLLDKGAIYNLSGTLILPNQIQVKTG